VPVGIFEVVVTEHPQENDQSSVCKRSLPFQIRDFITSGD
jgi:hypothetical protein